MEDEKIILLYDQECPVCDAYCRRVKLKDAECTLEMHNAREPGQIVDEITTMGLDADQGMVVKMDGRVYHGADAIHVLAVKGSRSGVFGRFTTWIFSSRHLARLLYPVLRGGRNLLLKMLGKTKINNLGRDKNDMF